MTLTPEQIKEAVELADTWDHDFTCFWCCYDPPLPAEMMYSRFDNLVAPVIAALASQLISQVDAMDGCSVSVSEECATAFHPSGYFQHGYNQHNRDENSILACCELLREKGNEPTTDS